MSSRPLRVLLASGCVVLLAQGVPVRAQGAWQQYQYDSLGNLVGSWDSAGRNVQSRYDASDNRVSVDVTQGAPAPEPPPPGPAGTPASPRYHVIDGPPGTSVFPQR